MGNGLDKRNRFTDIVCMFPIFVFVLSIVLVRLHLFSMPLTNIYWTEALDTTTLSDLFSYWKSMAILLAGYLSIIVFVIGYFKNQIKFKSSFLYIPALVYILFVTISYVFSDYKYFALRGMQEHFEGTFVLIAYILMIFFLFNVVDSDRRVKSIVCCTLSIAVLLGLLGATQATGHDFFTTTIGQKLITPNNMVSSGLKSWDMIDLLAAQGERAYNFSFTEGEVYQTVYNINYVPLYLSLLLPISAILFVFYSIGEGKKSKIVASILLIVYGLLLYNFFSANSASGYIGLITVFIIALVLFHKYLTKWYKSILCLLIVLGLTMGLTVDRWLPEIQPLLSNATKIIATNIYADDITSINTNYDKYPASVWMPVDYIETSDNQVIFALNESAIIITRDNANGTFIITDGDNQQLYLTNISGQDNKFQILDDRFHDYAALSLVKDETGKSYVVISTQRGDWHFLYDESGFRYRNSVGKFIGLTSVPHSDLIHDYSLASARGWIWATTIPMLKSYLIVGAGADVFPFVYPQNDYATLYSHPQWIIPEIVADKAHNLYMQYWVNTGLISLLAWLTMVGYYLVGAVKQFRRRGFVDFCDFVNGGIFCGICGFLAVAFFNDGSVNTMPMFYTMLGTGLAINMRDKWPEAAPVGETSGDGPSTGSGPVGGKKKGKKVKAGAEAMPEM